MKNVCFRITLDINDSNSQISLPIRRADTNRSIYVSLTEDGFPVNLSDCFATCGAKLENGSDKLTATCLTDLANNRFELIIPPGMSQSKGMWECSLDVYNSQNEGHIGTPRFNVVVDERIFDLTDEEAGEAGYTTDLLDTVNGAAANATLAANNAARCALDAQAATKTATDLLDTFDSKVDEKWKPYEERFDTALGCWVEENIKWEGEENVRKENEKVRIANEEVRIAADNERRKWVAPVIEKTIENWLDETVSDGGLSSIDFNRLTPQMFGAVGDGETDDSEAIQRMINAAKPGTKIVFPEGEYLIHPYASEGYRYSKETGSTIRVGNRNKNNDGTDSVYADFAYHFAIEKGSEWMAGSDIYGMFGVILYQKKDLEIVFEPGAKLKSVAISVDNPIVETITYPNVNYVSNGVVVGQGDADVAVNSNQNGAYFFYLNKCENITIQGGEFIGDIDDLPVDEDGNPIDLSIENPVRNIFGLPITSCKNVKVVGVHSHNWRFSPIHIGGNPKSNNITIDGCVCHDSYYHALVVEGADNVTVRNTKAYRADTGKGSVFGTSLDCEGVSETNLNENITIEGCEFGYAQTNALNIIKCKNVTVRNCTIKDKPMAIQDYCSNINITQNSFLEIDLNVDGYAIDDIHINKNYIKNGRMRVVSDTNANNKIYSVFIENNYLNEENDEFVYESVPTDENPNPKRIYKREFPCIDLALKNNAIAYVSGNTIMLKNGACYFLNVDCKETPSTCLISRNRFLAGSDIEPVTDVRFHQFLMNGKINFCYNEVRVIGNEATTLNNGKKNSGSLNFFYIKGYVWNRCEITYNTFDIKIPRVVGYLLMTEQGDSYSNEGLVHFHNNIANVNMHLNYGLLIEFENKNAYDIVKKYFAFNNILNGTPRGIIHSASNQDVERSVCINNIVNGVLQ